MITTKPPSALLDETRWWKGSHLSQQQHHHKKTPVPSFFPVPPSILLILSLSCRSFSCVVTLLPSSSLKRSASSVHLYHPVSPLTSSQTHTRTPPFSLLCTRVFFRTTHTHSDDRKSSQPSVSAVSRLLFWKRYLCYSRSILFYFYSLSLVEISYTVTSESHESQNCALVICSYTLEYVIRALIYNYCCQM